MNNIKYVITYYNKWKRSYYYAKDDRMCINTESSQYETDDKELALQIAKDFLDIPEARLSLDEIRKEFEDARVGALPEEKLVAIQNYYNGRLAMYEHVKAMFESEPWSTSIPAEDIQQTPLYSKRFDIPYEYNYFSTYAEDGEENKETQIDAYLNIDIYVV